MKPIVIFSYTYDNGRRGGAISMNRLAELLIEKGVETYVFPYSNRAEPSTVKEGIPRAIPEKHLQPNSFIGIYPEGFAHPMYAPSYAIQWLLHNRNSKKDSFDKYYHFEPAYAFGSSEPLKVLEIDLDKYSNDGMKREGVCHAYHKNRRAFLMEEVPAQGSRCVDGLLPTGDDLAAIFNSRETFYCYDSFSFLNILAACCGCYSIVEPQLDRTVESNDDEDENPVYMSREEYVKIRPFAEHLQYGMDGERVEGQTNKIRQAVTEQMKETDKQIDSLVKVIQDNA
jgi:hypothetical protein